MLVKSFFFPEPLFSPSALEICAEFVKIGAFCFSFFLSFVFRLIKEKAKLARNHAVTTVCVCIHVHIEGLASGVHIR